jgi:hypothetical protein
MVRKKELFLLPENIISGRYNRSIEPGFMLDEKKKGQVLAGHRQNPFGLSSF